MASAKRFFCMLLVLACLLTCLPIGQAQALTQYPTQFYLTQLASGTCTLCSATMLVRSAMLRQGSAHWLGVTEDVLKPYAWTPSVGLKWSFTYEVEDAIVKVGYSRVSGFTTESLKALLDEHPEGIVLYCGKIPHAVFLLGYEGDTFYCAETVQGYSGKTIPLAESWIGKSYGYDQDTAITNATAYWYVKDYEALESTDCDCSPALAGTYTCTAQDSLRIRDGHSTGSKILGTIPSGATVTVSRAGNGWAHVQYNGITGYASLDYLALQSYSHDYEATVIPATCLAGGYTLHICEDCGASFTDSPTDPLGHSFGDWTASGDQEIRTCTRCDATETREPQGQTWMGTVTGDSLRIRRGAGTSYAVVGYLNTGDRVEILEQKQVGSTTWGQIEKGWISLDYVKLDEAESEVPAEPEPTEPEPTEPEPTEPEPTEPEPTEPETQTMTGTVTATSLRIREGAGTSYKTLGYLPKGTRVEILETATVNGMTWGRTAQGWISLDYVELDKADEPDQTWTGTVNASCLRVRKEPTTASAIVGYLYRGAKVEILETKTVDGTDWGRTSQGWISLDYVN